METEWITNTGVRPDAVTSDFIVLVIRYRDGFEFTACEMFDPDYWELQGDHCDIVEWRLV